MCHVSNGIAATTIITGRRQCRNNRTTAKTKSKTACCKVASKEQLTAAIISQLKLEALKLELKTKLQSS